MVDTYNLTGGVGGFGGQGISQTTSAAALSAMINTTGSGNHLDVMDCTVCHVQKTSMVVRDLDATSGARFPVVLGTDMSKGMMGLFEDPAPDAANIGAIMTMYNPMYAAIDAAYGLTAGMPGYLAPLPTDGSVHVIGGKLQTWQPALMWQKNGNMALPLTDKNISGDAVQPVGLSFRRKITLNNVLCAILWNNTDNTIDANGDGAKGGLLNSNYPTDPNAAPGLAGYKDIFTNQLLSENNAQGYDLPIFDPWVMRDLKAGMNFGAAGFAPISIGFGNGTYQSAYNPNFSFTGAAKYVSVWSGAYIFTEPDQIKAYKDMRTAMDPSKPWTKTELSYIAITPLVTHGIQPTATYVKGRLCSDCHAPGKGFFDGTMNMSGSAIPADPTYNPTSQLSTGANPLDGTGAVLDANGNYTRIAGLPGLDSSSNMMQRPLEWIPRIKAYKNDLRTEYEDFNKLGQARELSFDKISADGQYRYTTDIDRANILYPYVDGAIYYAITDTAHSNPMDGKAYAAYLTAIAAPPVAQISKVASNDVTGAIGDTSANPIVVTQGNVALLATAAGALDASTYTYTWTCTDSSVSATGQSTTRAFNSLGSFILTLTATNTNTNQSTTNTQYIKVVAPAPTSQTTGVVTITGAKTASIALSNMPAHTKLSVTWGDGGISSYTTTTATYTLTHSYYLAAPGKLFTTTVKLLNSSNQVVDQVSLPVQF
jgi:hypothetical protein